jgi:hypothetical protein
VTLPVVAPYAIGIGLLSAAFQHWYGSPNLQTSYQAVGVPAVGAAHWDFWYQYALRDILDPVVGWIPFAPVHWLGFAALGCLVVRFGWPALGCVAALAGYELFISSIGTAVGWGMPARYPMIMVPLIAVPLAVAIQHVRAARLVFAPLLAVSIVFAVEAARHYVLLYPGEVQQIVGMRSTAPAFPSLSGVQNPASFTTTPGGPPTAQTGKLEGSELVGRAPRDKAGFLISGPYVPLRRGAYQATFSLAAKGVRPEEPVAVIQVVGAGGAVILGNKVVVGRELRPSRLSDIDLSFATSGGYPIETRVYYRDRGTLRAGPITVQPIVAPQPATHYRDWPLAFVWVAGTFLVGWLFVQVMTLSRQT